MSTFVLPNNTEAKMKVYAEEYVVPSTFNRPALRTLMNDTYILSLIKSLSGDMLVLYDDLSDEMDDIANQIQISLTGAINTISGQIDSRLNSLSSQLLPIGAGLPWPLTNNIPDSFLPALGGEYLRTDYPDLFALIGTTQGSGSGTTHFKLPNYGYKYGLDSKMYIIIIRATDVTT